MDTCGKISRSCALASLPSTCYAPYAPKTIPSTSQNDSDDLKPSLLRLENISDHMHTYSGSGYPIGLLRQ